MKLKIIGKDYYPWTLPNKAGPDATVTIGRVRLSRRMNESEKRRQYLKCRLFLGRLLLAGRAAPTGRTSSRRATPRGDPRGVPKIQVLLRAIINSSGCLVGIGAEERKLLTKAAMENLEDFLPEDIWAAIEQEGDQLFANLLPSQHLSEYLSTREPTGDHHATATNSTDDFNNLLASIIDPPPTSLEAASPGEPEHVASTSTVGNPQPPPAGTWTQQLAVGQPSCQAALDSWTDGAAVIPIPSLTSAPEILQASDIFFVSPLACPSETFASPTGSENNWHFIQPVQVSVSPSRCEDVQPVTISAIPSGSQYQWVDASASPTSVWAVSTETTAGSPPQDPWQLRDGSSAAVSPQSLQEPGPLAACSTAAVSPPSCQEPWPLAACSTAAVSPQSCQDPQLLAAAEAVGPLSSQECEDDLEEPASKRPKLEDGDYQRMREENNRACREYRRRRREKEERQGRELEEEQERNTRLKARLASLQDQVDQIQKEIIKLLVRQGQNKPLV